MTYIYTIIYYYFCCFYAIHLNFIIVFIVFHWYLLQKDPHFLKICFLLHSAEKYAYGTCIKSYLALIITVNNELIEIRRWTKILSCLLSKELVVICFIGPLLCFSFGSKNEVLDNSDLWYEQNAKRNTLIICIPRKPPIVDRVDSPRTLSHSIFLPCTSSLYLVPLLFRHLPFFYLLLLFFFFPVALECKPLL